MTVGIKTRRVVFTFHDSSVKTLEQMTKDGQYSSMADTVRESLQITRVLQTAARQGFRELIVRNPRTDRERQIVVPRFKCLTPHRGRDE